MKNLFIVSLLLQSVYAGFCKKPAFKDDFLQPELSKMWDSAQGYSYETSPAVFTSLNVYAEKKYAIISVNNITTSDSDGETYNYTCGELHSAVELGFGRYEFEIKVSGNTAVNESFYLLWMDGDYTTDHESIGFEFQEAGYLTMLGLGVEEEDEYNAFHTTPKNSATMSPEKLNKRVRKFAIEYTKQGIIWFYNGKAIRQESKKAKANLPDHKFKVIFRNWLLTKYVYNIQEKDFPVELKVRTFSFYPVDEGGDSCAEIQPPVEESEKTEAVVENTVSETGSSAVINSNDLRIAIENLPSASNSLLGTSVRISDFSVFKSVKVVWIFMDYKWKGYSPINKIQETLKVNNIPIFSDIPPHTGFWIQK